MARKKKVTTNYINHNRVLKLSDYQVFGAKNRKTWEVSMALKALRELSGTHPDALILGLGAGHEPTIFELANENDARMVFATDIYLNSGSWTGTAPNNFMKSFDDYAPKNVKYDRSRMVAQHVDMRDLPYPDNYFNAIFSSGSIEHLATYEDMALSSKEMGRVLKPGGILSLSTEWKISGSGFQWDNVRLFDEEKLMQYIIIPSGCKMVGEFDSTFDGSDEDCYDLLDIINSGEMPETEYYLRSPRGHQFTSVHIALEKSNGATFSIKKVAVNKPKVIVAEEAVDSEVLATVEKADTIE